MKHFIIILLILILTGFAVGISYLSVNHNTAYSWLFVPECIFIIMLGIKIDETYRS
jgi:hypothetical protein